MCMIIYICLYGNIIFMLEQVIIKQGELGDLFFCLETGSAAASVSGNVVMTYQPGGCFGELALIYNSPRAASVGLPDY